MELLGHIERWLDGRQRRGEISPRSRYLFSCRFRDLVAVHGDRAITALDRPTVDRWLAAIGRHSPATRRSYLSVVRCFCKAMVDEGILDADPTVHVPRVREPRRVPRAQPAETVGRVLAVAHNTRDRLIVHLMVGMGLRCVEVARLELADWDPVVATLLIRGKAGHERLLPVPEAVTEAIEAYLEERDLRAGPLVRTRGRGLTGGVSAHRLSGLVGRLMTEAGAKHSAYDGVSAHSLRHTAASDVLDRCGNVRTVQVMLGHASLATTQIYLRRASLGQLRQAMEGRSYLMNVEVVPSAS